MRGFRYGTERVLLLAALAAGACDDGYGPDPMSGLAGRYAATEFSVTVAGATVDLIAAGASLDLTLSPDGSTSGLLLAFPGAPGVDMAGRWVLEDGVVTLDQPAETIIRQMRFVPAPPELQGEATNGDSRFRLTLRRQAPAPGPY